ncbi:MAG TPA: hypothetical protein VHU77_12965 [Candidatus Limnocylindria bacterium]|jgi:hypothetical protein|nr:hypothetical protein [Candidatus Limnocylindria bacterium]
MRASARGLVIRVLLRCYPTGWRGRYGEELEDLIASERLTLRVAADVGFAGLRQRARAIRTAAQGGIVMTIGPAWRHPTAFALISFALLLPTFVFVAASTLTYQLGVDGLRGLMEPLHATLQRVRVFDLLLVAAPPVAFLAAVAPLVRLGVERRDGGMEAVVAVRARALNVVIGLVALGVAGMLIWHIVIESVLQVGP